MIKFSTLAAELAATAHAVEHVTKDHPGYGTFHLWKTPHAKAEAYEDKHNLRLNWMETHKDHQHKGHAAALLHHITKHADQAGKTVDLVATPDLHPMYQKHGFVQHDTASGSKFGMIRHPKK